MCVECGHRVFVTEERRAIRAELLEAKEALGPAWILEGETLADGIRRKMQKLEELAK
jgi:heme oxygenase